MTFKHLKFEELSDLIDNLLTDDEREACLTHISQCKECEKEYQSLLKTISLVSSLKKEDLALPDFSRSTISIYKKREKSRLLYKVIPAIAASVLIVIGIGLFKIGAFNRTTSHFEIKVTEHADDQKIFDHIGNLQVKVITVNHSFIDTEFDKDMFADFQKLLHKNQIKHTVITNSLLAINSFEKNTEAFVGPLAKDSNNLSAGNEKIQIRIFKFLNHCQLQ